MKTLEDLQKLVVQFRDDRDWAQYHRPKDMAISLSLEAAELLEHFQWKEGADVDSHIRDAKQDIGDELSDVMYWVLLMAHDFGISIEDAFIKKLHKNAEKYPVDKSKGRSEKYSKLRNE